LICRILKTKKTEKSNIASTRLSLLINTLMGFIFCEIPEKYWKIPSYDARILKALNLLSKAENPLSNEELAHAVFMSTNSFIRLFKNETGNPPQAYQTNLRLDRASIDMLYTRDSIDQIAENNGFCDRHYFSKMFKKYRNVSPAAYRRLSLH
jgi:transcriptional regulator GlxA family with amidase domain